jgi:hypothetical protein
MRRALLLALALLAALPAAASGHAFVRLDGGTLLYWARDAGAESTLTITVQRNRVRVVDPAVYGGIDPGSCDPGAVDRDGFVVEVLCPRSAVTALRVEVGPEDDGVTIREADDATPLESLVLGGPGADRLSGGGGADVLFGSEGIDMLDGGAGDDEVHAQDGVADQLACGDGRDRAIVDPVDPFDPTCEAVEPRFAAPEPEPAATEAPPGQPPPGTSGDTVAPTIEGRAPRRQHVTARRALRLFVFSNETGRLRATAVVRAGGRRLRLGPVTRGLTVAGQEQALTLRSTRALRRALRARGRLTATVTAVVTDEAGNSASTKLPRIVLIPTN